MKEKKSSIKKIILNKSYKKRKNAYYCTYYNMYYGTWVGGLK